MITDHHATLAKSAGKKSMERTGNDERIQHH